MRQAVELAEKLADQGRVEEALAAAWDAAAEAPEALRPKRLIAILLQRRPNLVRPNRRTAFLDLLRDDDVDPSLLANAGWHLLGAEMDLSTADAGPATERLERSDLALLLLEQSLVASLDAEKALTSVRRHLLMSGTWADHPRLAAALVRQAELNGGAWWFDEQERERLQEAGSFAAAYLASAPSAPERSDAQSVAERVTAQYRRWPYPAWKRILRPLPATVTDVVRQIDPAGPPLRASAEILIAGCGTGREARTLAQRFPEARITAIDMSEASLAYAEERCAGLGVRFRRLDLHHAAELGQEFDLISCSGVLHHLQDPEAAWAALVAVLRPAGVMRVMLYSKIARLRVEGARCLIADLIGREVTDDLLREARHRIAQRAPSLLSRSTDFYSLAGFHDLVLHPHEDPFDIPRIRRALEELELDLLAFTLPSGDERLRYLEQNPGDPLCRDFDGWMSAERNNPFLFAGMYEFWCRRRT